jgi:DNA-binding transcriptional LysR family regulator
MRSTRFARLPPKSERGYLLVTQRAATPAVSAFRQWLLGECGLDAE